MAVAFPIKRIQGEELEVWADIFRDGHDTIAAAIRIQQFGETGWTLVPMQFFDNDRWVGRVVWIGSAWRGSRSNPGPIISRRGRTDVTKKRQGGPDAGPSICAKARSRSAPPWIVRRRRFAPCWRRAGRAGRGRRRRGAGRSAAVAPLANVMALVPDKSDRVLYEPMLGVMVDREAARFSAWYEMFPRSQARCRDKAPASPIARSGCRRSGISV